MRSLVRGRSGKLPALALKGDDLGMGLSGWSSLPISRIVRLQPGHLGSSVHEGRGSSGLFPMASPFRFDNALRGQKLPFQEDQLGRKGPAPNYVFRFASLVRPMIVS
jgi:hypothetical protein